MHIKKIWNAKITNLKLIILKESNTETKMCSIFLLLLLFFGCGVAWKRWIHDNFINSRWLSIRKVLPYESMLIKLEKFLWTTVLCKVIKEKLRTKMKSDKTYLNWWNVTTTIIILPYSILDYNNNNNNKLKGKEKS